MPVKMRLQRNGRKRYAYYHIVIADSRAPRDGRNIERIGTYNPNTNPATIDLEFDKALDWLTKGAQPTDTVRAILSYKGVLYKKHLLGGVSKGAFNEEEAERRFQTWVTEKDAKVQAKIDRLTGDIEAERKKQLDAETKVSEERAAAIAKRNSDLIAEQEAVRKAAEAEAAAERAAAEAAAAPAEAPVVEEEVAVEEAAPEAVAEVVAEEVAPEAVTEEAAPEAEEVKAETEAPAKDAPATEPEA